MKHLTCAALACLLIGCSQGSEEALDVAESDPALTAQPITAPEVIAGADPIVGNDRTEQGCVSSAGYQWSIIDQSCVRLWEVGVELTHQGSGESAFSAFAITNESQAELFLPEQAESVILTRDDTPDGVISWSDETTDFRLSYDPANALILTDLSGGLALLIHKAPGNPIGLRLHQARQKDQRSRPKPHQGAHPVYRSC